MHVTIDTVREASKELKKSIEMQIRQFEYYTGCTVESVDVLRVRCIGQKNSQLVDVKLAVRM